MDVKDFVKNTIIQIVSGVAEAIKEAEAINRAVVNPTAAHANYANTENIKFDIAVTVQDDTTIKGSGGVAIAVLKASGGTEVTSTNTAVSRISFSVPVALPSTAVKQYEQAPSINRQTSGF